MNWFDQKALMCLANLVLCFGIGYVCLCRIAKMEEATTRKMTRLVYALVGATAATSGGWYWITGDWANWNDLFVNATLLIYMTSGARAWKFGVPEYAQREHQTPSPSILRRHAP